MHELDAIDEGLVGACDRILDEILDGLDVVVRLGLQVAHGFGVGVVEVLPDLLEMRFAFGVDGQFRDLGQACQVQEPLHFHAYAVAMQSELADDRGQITRTLGVPPVERGDRGQPGLLIVAHDPLPVASMRPPPRHSSPS